MKRLLPFLVAALLVPGAALAKGPNPHSGTHASSGKSAGKNVMYVLKGTLSNYMAYDATTSTAGSITIAVSHANRHGRMLVGQSLTLPVGANTKVVLANGNTTVSNGDLGIVKVRAPKAWDKNSTDLAAFLGGYSARQIIDPANLPNPAADANSNSNSASGTVMYVLKGTLSGYSSYDSTSGTAGSVTIDVSRANRHGRALVGQSLTFTGMVVSSTRLVLGNGASVIANGDRGIVKVRAPKAWNLSSSDLMASLEQDSVFQIIDQQPAAS